MYFNHNYSAKCDQWPLPTRPYVDPYRTCLWYTNDHLWSDLNLYFHL